MNNNKIISKIVKNTQEQFSRRLDRICDRNVTIDIFDYREILRDKYNFSYSRNTNNFYGLDSILKRYAGYKKELYIATEHGVQLPGGENYLNVAEYRDNLAHVLLTSAKLRAESLTRYSDKTIIPIGPYIQYAETVYDDEIMMQIKANLGRTLLVFPQHSCENELIECESKNFIEYVKKIKNEKMFDTVLVCVYFYDFIQGLHIPYEREGWTIITAGHRQNKRFLDYLKTYILLADHVLFQGYTSSVGYALAMRKPVLAYPYHHELTKESKIYEKAMLDKSGNILFNRSEGEKLYFKTFCDYSDEISDKQLKWAEDCISLSIRKTPEEMTRIFNMAWEMYWNLFGETKKIINKYDCLVL